MLWSQLGAIKNLSIPNTCSYRPIRTDIYTAAKQRNPLRITKSFTQNLIPFVKYLQHIIIPHIVEFLNSHFNIITYTVT